MKPPIITANPLGQLHQIALANAGVTYLEPLGANQLAGLQHRAIAVANDSMFNEAFFNEPLTTYSVGGWDRDPLKEILDFICPPTEVPMHVSYDEFTNAEEFVADSEADVKRSIGGEYAVVKPYTTTERTKTVPDKGLTIVLDRRKMASKGGEERHKQRAVRRLRNRLFRVELNASVALLSAAATNTDRTWDSNADPDADVDGSLEAAGDASGLEPNRVFYGRKAWRIRRNAFRAQNNAGGYASAQMTEEAVADYLGVSQVLCGKARYQSSDNAKTQIAGDKVISFNAEMDLGPEDPSNIKRLWSPTVAGNDLMVFEQVLGPNLIAITVAHNSLPALTSTLGIRQETISAS